MSTVAAVLARKGHDVATIDGARTLGEAAVELDRWGIGALVVPGDGWDVRGVLSERDIVRAVAARGPTALEDPVAQVMSTQVTTCGPATTLDELVATMTTRRIRHVPVLADGVLTGIVSIGDVVKWRMDELQEEAGNLQAYVQGSY